MIQEWKNLSEVQPKKRQLCDFIAPGDDLESGIWMLCRATIIDWNSYHHSEPNFWREAENLPDFIKESNGE